MRRALIPTIAFAAIATAIAIGVTAGTSDDGGAEPAPPLPFEVLVGPRVTLADLRGEPAAINFWASWCQPCREESPELERLFRSLHGRAGLVGVDVTDDAGSAREMIRELHLTYPNLRDPNGEAGDGYGLSGLPATTIIDSRGRIVEVLRGPQTAASVGAALRRAG